MSMDVVITLPEIARERLERVLHAISERNPYLAQRHYLTFVLELGILHAEQIFRLPPLEPKAPSGVFTVTEED